MALNTPSTPLSPLEYPLWQAPIRLPITHFWDGEPCSNPGLHGEVRILPVKEGLEVVASLPHQPVPALPDAPAGARVHGLWQFDVVELFLAGAEGYTELELGPGGHFLLFRFSAPRVLSDACETLQLPLYLTPLAADGRSWSVRTIVPWSLLPTPLERLNAYAIAGGQYLCFSPLPGEKPDFHQPHRFPLLSSVLTGGE